MDQRIVEILMYVIGQIRSRRMEREEVEGLSDDLLQRGFSPPEVAAALSYFIERFQKRPPRDSNDAATSPRSHRVLHAVEKMFLDAHAYGYLLQLCHLGVLDASDLEAILERVLMIGNVSITEDEVKRVVVLHLMESDPRGWLGPTHISFANGPSESIH
jgi:uncharacterized protein Smg (DUF494 family)